MTLFTSAGGARRRSAGRRTSVSAYERALREAERTKQINKAAELERGLVSVHLENFAEAEPGIAPAPDPVDATPLRWQFRNEELAGISIFDRTGRKEAKSRAEDRLRTRAAELNAEREEERRKLQEELDKPWQALLANEPETVLSALEEAFEDNESPAVAIDCRGDEVTIVVLYPTPDFLPEQKPALTPTGKLTLHKRTKTEINDLYARSLASSVLATVREAFAVAPAINEVRVLVVRRDLRGSAAQYLSAIYAGSFVRERFETYLWVNVDPVEELYLAPGALMKRKGSTAEIVSLDLRAEPELAAVVDEIRSALVSGTLTAP